MLHAAMRSLYRADWEACAGAPLPTEDREDVQAQLCGAVKEGDVEQVKELLQQKAEVNHKYSFGLTPLHFAALHNQADVALVLLVAGANVHATTADDEKITPGMLADAEGHKEVLRILGDGAVLKTHCQQRFLGPGVVAAVILTNVAVALAVTDPECRWDGWQEATDDSSWGSRQHRQIVVCGACLSLFLLVLLNAMNPGGVEREEVAYVGDLWAQEDERKVVVDTERFGYMREDGGTDVYAWCTSCELWRPKNVSHCSTCRRCFWRFDHHCAAVGTCIAAGNHLAFAVFILCAASSWMFAVVAVILHFRVHGAALSLSTLLQASTDNWSIYLAVPWVVVGTFCSSVLLAFGSFHTTALFLNFNTKIIWKPKDDEPRCRCNSTEVFGRIFLSPLRLRTCGAPDPFLRKEAEGPHGVCSARQLCNGKMHVCVEALEKESSNESFDTSEAAVSEVLL